MIGSYVLAGVLVFAGIAVLLASWVVHWVLLALGLGLLALAVYVAAGGQIPGL